MEFKKWYVKRPPVVEQLRPGFFRNQSGGLCYEPPHLSAEIAERRQVEEEARKSDEKEQKAPEGVPRSAIESIKRLVELIDNATTLEVQENALMVIQKELGLIKLRADKAKEEVKRPKVSPPKSALKIEKFFEGGTVRVSKKAPSQWRLDSVALASDLVGQRATVTAVHSGFVSARMQSGNRKTNYIPFIVKNWSANIQSVIKSGCDSTVRKEKRLWYGPRVEKTE